MFKVLLLPVDGVVFDRKRPFSLFGRRSHSALVYEGTKGSRVLISCTKGTGPEVEMMEMAAEWLNHSPSLEFTRLLLRAISDVWKEWQKNNRSKLLRTLQYESMFQTRDRQPPFAPNNGEHPDGIW